MKIKILTLVFILLSLHNIAYAESDAAMATDIAAFIDEYPIPSYNVNDSTYILAESLINYGFTVIWNHDERTLKITRSGEYYYQMPSKDEINILKSDIPVGTKIFDVYKTDIKVYLDDESVECIRIDGSMLIKFRELSRYGYVNFSEKTRQAKAEIIMAELDRAYEAAEKQEIKLSESSTYIGEVLDGKPNGIGKITSEEEVNLKTYEYSWHTKTTYTYTSDIFTSLKSLTFGYFKNGELDGIVYKNHDKIGSYNPGGAHRYFEVKENYWGYSNYVNGVLDGIYQLTKWAQQYETTDDFFRYYFQCTNGMMNGIRYNARYDKDYLYDLNIYVITEDENEDFPSHLIY